MTKKLSWRAFTFGNLMFSSVGLSESFAHHNWKQNPNNFLNWPQPRWLTQSQRGRLALFCHGAGHKDAKDQWPASATGFDGWPAAGRRLLAQSQLVLCYSSIHQGRAPLLSPRSLNFQQVLPWYREPPHLRPTTWIALVLRRCCCRMLQNSSVRWRKWQPALAWKRVCVVACRQHRLPQLRQQRWLSNRQAK